MTYERPLRRLRESIELVKLYSNNGYRTFDNDGEVFQVERALSLDTAVSVYNGALGPRNLALTGEICDGWIPLNISFSTIEDKFELIAEVARNGERGPSAIEAVPFVPAVVRRDSETAKRMLRKWVATIIGWCRDDTYRDAMDDRFGDEPKRIAEVWRSGARDEAICMVSDSMLEERDITGNPTEVRYQLRDLLDRPVVNTPMTHPNIGTDQADLANTTVELRSTAL